MSGRTSGVLDSEHSVEIPHWNPRDFDPASLKLPHIQRQFERILAVGGSELTADQIDWDAVIAKWSIP